MQVWCCYCCSSLYYQSTFKLKCGMSKRLFFLSFCYFVMKSIFQEVYHNIWSNGWHKNQDLKDLYALHKLVQCCCTSSSYICTVPLLFCPFYAWCSHQHLCYVKITGYFFPNVTNCQMEIFPMSACVCRQAMILLWFNLRSSYTMLHSKRS